MLRTRLLLILGACACGFESGGVGDSGSSSSSGSETDMTTTLGPTTTVNPTTTMPTTSSGTDSATDATTDDTADTGTDTSTTEDPDTSGSESTGEPTQWGPFEDIARIDEISDMFAADDDPTLTGDMLELYFNSNRLGQEDVFVATRASIDDPFDMPVVVIELSTAFIETVPELSPDGLVMTLSSNVPGGAGGFDAFISTREDRDSTWSALERITEINTVEGDGSLSMTADALTAVLCVNFPGTADNQLMTTTRRSADDDWDVPAVIEALLTDGRECSPWLAADGSELWFGSTRDAPASPENIYRVAMDGIEPGGEVEEVVELSSEGLDDDPWLSPDGSVIVFTSNRDGNLDIYQARREQR